MNLVDMHVHTVDSPDGEIPAVDLVERAISEGVSVLGFVAHVNMNPDDFCYGVFDPVAYRRSLEEARKLAKGEPLILEGLEVGEPHRFREEVAAVVDCDDFDFITGALHHVRGIGIALGAEVFGEHEPEIVVEAYLRETLEMVEIADMDMLAHFGIYRRGLFLAGKEGFPSEVELWPGLVEKILGTLMDRDIALELNTSGLRRKERCTYPSPEVLAMYHGMGGRLVSIGSDSHKDPYVFFGLRAGLDLLRQTGFEKVHIYRRRRREAMVLS